MVSIRGIALVAACACVATAARADVHLVRSATGSALIFNDSIGSGWRVNGAPPNDAYLIERKNAPTPFDDTIVASARSAGVDPSLVKCVMLVESNYNPRALSKKGARGLMQLMPATARRFGVADSFDAVQNIRGGVRYISELLAMFNGNIAFALAAYNAGEGAVARHAGVPPYAETQEYVRRALVAYHGTSIGLGAGTPGPMIGGSFRGVPTRMAIAAAFAKVRVDKGARLLSNAGPARRVSPVLGRTEPVTVAAAAASKHAEAPILGRVSP
jgi:hypothetical protein